MKKATLVAASALLLAGCGSTKIGRILSDPARYQGRSVSVEGRVTNSYGVSIPGLRIPSGVYQIDDGTGKIYVLANSGVPTKESRVKVSGRVTPGLTVAGRNYGTAIQARDMKVRY